MSSLWTGKHERSGVWGAAVNEMELTVKFEEFGVERRGDGFILGVMLSCA
jgi:hypothetical protein